MKPNVFVFASGTKDGGGSGFETLINSINNEQLQANIVGVVSNHKNGGVAEKAERLGVPFYYEPGPWTAEKYQEIATRSGADFFALSGWMIKIKGLDLDTKFSSKTVFNIHPGPLPYFGGKGMYGHHVHEAVWEAYQNGLIVNTEVTMHFVDEEFDHGPTFFKLRIPIAGIHSADELGSLVNHYEHIYQPMITNMVVNGLIYWDGINPESLIFPVVYKIDHDTT
jgi:phosphoribosylglycinamide formyltransferase-1